MGNVVFPSGILPVLRQDDCPTCWDPSPPTPIRWFWFLPKLQVECYLWSLLLSSLLILWPILSLILNCRAGFLGITHAIPSYRWLTQNHLQNYLLKALRRHFWNVTPPGWPSGCHCGCHQMETRHFLWKGSLQHNTITQCCQTGAQIRWKESKYLSFCLALIAFEEKKKILPNNILCSPFILDTCCC